jgi:hypothetical protein
MLYQYIGTEYTMVQVVKWEPKVKVVNGEIIESDLEEKYFTKNRFQVVPDDTTEETKTDEKPKIKSKK